MILSLSLDVIESAKDKVLTQLASRDIDIEVVNFASSEFIDVETVSDCKHLAE